MEVTGVLVQPPSLVAQIEGKANKAITEKKTKEMIQEAEEKSDEQKAQEAINLLV